MEIRIQSLNSSKKFISSAEKHPELIGEYSPNNEIPLSEVSYGSEKKRKWICELIKPIHEYEMTPYQRHRGQSCNQKKCIDKKRIKTVRKQAVERSLSFGDKYPYRVKQWHEDNDESPYNISINSHYPAKLICEYGHAWTKTVQQHVEMPKCPYCYKIKSWGSLETYEKFKEAFPENLNDNTSHKYRKLRYKFTVLSVKHERIKIKYLVMSYYSKLLSNSEIPCCNCCGENTYLEFLAIDHILPIRRRTLKSTNTGYSTYKKLLNENFPNGYQVLCHNCNLAKRDKNNCPHNEENN